MGLFDFFKKKDATTTVTDAAAQVGTAATDTASQVGDAVTNGVSSAVDAVQPVVGAAVDGVSNAADTVIEKRKALPMLSLVILTTKLSTK